MIDNLDYFYESNSNQLKKVVDLTNSTQGFKDDGNGTIDSDPSDDYDYDDAGNMIKDENKNINTITYNHLNLPTQIEFTQNRKINYTYDATGVKLKKVVHYSDYEVSTEYLNGYQYERKPVDHGGRGYSHLLFFPHAEGYVKPVYSLTIANKDPKWQYVYNYKDHLGSVRLSYTKVNGVIKVLEENNYYPLGMKHSNYNQTKKKLTRKVTNDQKQITPTIENPYKYKFSGQERQNEFDLNWDSFRWRNYDYATGRFMSIDPLAESFYYMTPYQFASNSPAWKIELEGLEGIKSQEFDANGNFKNHVIEKNVVVLTKKAIPMPTFREGTNTKKIARKTKRNTKENAKITKNNASRVAKVKSSLSKAFGNAKNEAGESVKFQFNVIAQQVDDTKGSDGRAVRAISRDNGLTSKNGVDVPAAVITTDKNPIGVPGHTSSGNLKLSFNDFSSGVISHEVGHTLLVRGDGNDDEHSTNGLMTKKTINSSSHITPTETKNMLEDAFE